MYDYIKTDEYSLEDVYPQISMDNVKEFLEDYQKFDKVDIKKHKSLDDLPDEIQRLLKQVYITKNLKSKEAIKARFSRYMQSNKFFNNREILEKGKGNEELNIDMIFKNSQSGISEALFILDVLDKNKLKRIEKIINSYNEKINEKKSKSDNTNSIQIVFLICGRINRTVAEDLERYQSGLKDFKLKVFLEFEDSEKNFEDDDLIIVEDFEIKGFNFGSLEEVLSLIKNEKGKGKYTIYAQDSRGFKKVIWEGYVFPKKIME